MMGSLFHIAVNYTATALCQADMGTVAELASRNVTPISTCP
jgi:hypothetical protein